MSAAWLEGDMLSFDLETTGSDPETARIVTAACIEVGSHGVLNRQKWLVNPGIPIPAEATAIHGITDEIAATGFTPGEALSAIEATIMDASLRGLPLVIMCAGYDLTVKAREQERLGRGAGFGMVLDPLVIDRACDPYRKGKRTLTALAAHYGVTQGEAHSADGDALTAARIIWKQARIYSAIADLTLREMQEFQRNAHAAWAVNFEAYLRKQGKQEAISTDWPVRQSTKEAA